MEIKIENILILWDEKVTDIFVSLINTLSLSFSETEIRNSMAKLSENENFGRLFAYGFGAHHLWVAQRMITDPEKVMENRLLIVEFLINDYHDNKNDHQRSEYLPDGRY